MVNRVALAVILTVSFAASASEPAALSRFVEVSPGPSALEAKRALGHEDLQLDETYRRAIAAVVQESLRSTPWPLQQACRVELGLLPGGEVIRVDLTDCALPPEAQERMSALLVAHPLPYYGFQRIFLRTASVRLEPR